MRLTLVDNLVMPEEGDTALLDVHPHLGLLALAASAARDGVRTSIYDPKRLLRSGVLRYDEALYDRAAASILAQSPEAVGFTTLGCSFLFAINVAARLRRAEPDLPILLGGPHATMLDRPILERFPQFDLVVRHEADDIFPSVLRALPDRAFAKIPGLSWRDVDGGFRMSEGKPKVADLDSLPLLDYDLYPIADLGLDLLRIEAGRGCPFACTFCSTAGFFQRSFRLKSPERLVFELERLRERYGTTEFKLDHDMFTVNRHKVLAFCEAVRGRGFRWRVSARVDCVSPALLEKMAEAGCIGLYFGIETGSRRMQKISMKRLDLDLVAPILDCCEDLGIETTASFITGYPEETREDQDDTLDMIGHSLSPNCLTQLHILQPEPGTPMCAERGADLRYDGYSSPYNSYLIGPGDRELVLSTPEIFQTYFHYPAELPREQHLFAVRTVDLLRRVGPDVAVCALRRHDGRLSAFAAAFHAHALRAQPLRPPGWMPEAALLIDFVAAEYGARHPLVSLFRYGLALHADEAAPEPIPAVAYDAQRAWVLSDRVQLMRGLHDCEHWLARLRDHVRGKTADAPSFDDDDGPDCTYLLHRGRGRPEAWRIDAGVEAILDLFAQPRRGATVLRMLRDATGAAIDDAFFRELVDAGILVPASGQVATPRTATPRRRSSAKTGTKTDAKPHTPAAQAVVEVRS